MLVHVGQRLAQDAVDGLTNRMRQIDRKIRGLERGRHAALGLELPDLFAKQIDETVTSGGQPSSVFEESGAVEPYVSQALRTGEESGNLGGAMTYCADLLDETNTELVNAITKLIEPAILILMGMLVGGVAISLFVPLFDMTSAMR